MKNIYLFAALVGLVTFGLGMWTPWSALGALLLGFAGSEICFDKDHGHYPPCVALVGTASTIGVAAVIGFKGYSIGSVLVILACIIFTAFGVWLWVGRSEIGRHVLPKAPDAHEIAAGGDQ